MKTYATENTVRLHRPTCEESRPRNILFIYLFSTNRFIKVYNWVFTLASCHSHTLIWAFIRKFYVFFKRALLYTKVIKTNKMYTSYVNVLIYLQFLRHISNIQVFILRKTCTCSFFALLSCIHIYLCIKEMP